MVTQEVDWERRIARASTPEQIIDALRDSGLPMVADRLVYLCAVIEEDPAEQPVNLESLREFADFLLSEREFPQPEVGVAPGGLLQVEWEIEPEGRLAMEFLPPMLIRFAAVAGRRELGPRRQRVSGTCPKDDALRALLPFTAGLARS